MDQLQILSTPLKMFIFKVQNNLWCVKWDI